MPRASFNTTFSKEGLPTCLCLISYTIPALKKSSFGLKAVFPNSKNPAENESAGFFPSKYPMVSPFDVSLLTSHVLESAKAYAYVIRCLVQAFFPHAADSV